MSLYKSTPASHSQPSNMLTVTEITSTVANISILASGLLSSMPNGFKEDKIWAVINSDDGKTPHETFNKWFDAMFDEDCYDLHGHLHHIHHGKLGMGLVCSYLTRLNWTDFPLDLVKLKLQCLLVELKQLQCVSNSFLSLYTNEPIRHPTLMDSLCSLNQRMPQTQHQNSRMQTILRRQTSHSNARQLKNITSIRFPLFNPLRPSPSLLLQKMDHAQMQHLPLKLWRPVVGTLWTMLISSLLNVCSLIFSSLFKALRRSNDCYSHKDTH